MVANIANIVGSIFCPLILLLLEMFDWLAESHLYTFTPPPKTFSANPTYF